MDLVVSKEGVLSELRLRDSQSCGQIVNIAAPRNRVKLKEEMTVVPDEMAKECCTENHSSSSHGSSADSESKCSSERVNFDISSSEDSTDDDNLISDAERQASDNNASDNNKRKSTSPTADSKSRRRHRRRKAGAHHLNQRCNSVSNGTNNSTSNSISNVSSVNNGEKRVEKTISTDSAKKRRTHVQPMAPYNTTQFLMDQRDSTRTANQVTGSPQIGGIVAQSNSQELVAEDEFLKNEFKEAYKAFHAERLQNMDKPELVRLIVEMESRFEHLGTPREVVKDESFDVARERDLEEEIRRLRQENTKLVQDNQQLRHSASIKSGLA